MGKKRISSSTESSDQVPFKMLIKEFQKQPIGQQEKLEEELKRSLEEELGQESSPQPKQQHFEQQQQNFEKQHF